MRLSSIMSLYSNIYKKPRKLKGTYLFVYRYYIWGSTLGVSGLFFIGFYLSPLYNKFKTAFVDSIEMEYGETVSELNSTMPLSRSSKELTKNMLKQQKISDCYS